MAITQTVMEHTLSYENCPISFFTTNVYTNHPYYINGVKYDSDGDIKDAIQTKTWMTYRSNFEPITHSTISSDAGWGCAVRVGQMLLCETLSRLVPKHHDIQLIREHFLDNNNAIFSLHRLVAGFAGSDHNKIGTWLGPNNVCHSLKQTVNSSTEFNLQVHVSMDSTIAVPEIPNCDEKPLLLLLPLRLGLDSINVSDYGEDLLSILSYPQSVGIIGGKPRMAFYLFGYSTSSSEILALDPHTVKDSNDIQDADYTCTHPLIIPGVDKLDPSMALGFLCRNDLEFQDLLCRLENNKICAVMKNVPDIFDGCDVDVDLPDTDDEFEILC